MTDHGVVRRTHTLKQPGAWWTEENAHAFCQLRTVRANHQWENYWTKN